MIGGLLQTARSVLGFWRTTANLDGAHAELERNLMQDKWGPPANGEGWPTFDETGRRLLDRAFGPETAADKAEMDKHTAQVKRLLDPRPEDLEYAELGGEA